MNILFLDIIVQDKGNQTNEMMNICGWLKSNMLALNVAKTNHMIMTNKRSKVQCQRLWTNVAIGHIWDCISRILVGFGG